MSTVNRKKGKASIDHLEEAIGSGQDISDQYFSPGGVSAGRTLGKRREPAKNVRKVLAYRRNIDYGESLFHDLMSISAEMDISLQEWRFKNGSCAIVSIKREKKNCQRKSRFRR